jgi:hypothetical protein
MPAPARKNRVSFENSNIRGVRVLGIHADGAMTDTVLVDAGRVRVGKIQSTPNKT